MKEKVQLERKLKSEINQAKVCLLDCPRLDLYNYYIGTLNSDTLMPTRVLFYNLYKVFYLR